MDVHTCLSMKVGWSFGGAGAFQLAAPTGDERLLLILGLLRKQGFDGSRAGLGPSSVSHWQLEGLFLFLHAGTTGAPIYKSTSHVILFSSWVSYPY